MIEQLKYIWRRQPVMTFLLTGTNVLLFFLQALSARVGSAAALRQWGAVSWELVAVGGEYWRLFASMFLHMSFEHLLSNMFSLIVIGQVTEAALGHIPFLAVYLLSGTGASVFSLWFYHLLNQNVISAGASGAIFGILGALLAAAVRRHGSVNGISRGRILLLVLLMAYSGYTAVSVDNAAHLSGLAFGFLLGLLFCRRPAVSR
mgnify:CR=1 FL=1